MQQKTNQPLSQIVDIRQLGDTVEEIQEALKDPEVFDAIFGEPSDDEIAAAVRQAIVEFEAGDYEPTPISADEDDAPYIPETKEQVLRGIKQGYKEALAGDVFTLEEFRERLKE